MANQAAKDNALPGTLGGVPRVAVAGFFGIGLAATAQSGSAAGAASTSPAVGDHNGVPPDYKLGYYREHTNDHYESFCEIPDDA